MYLLLTLTALAAVCALGDPVGKFIGGTKTAIEEHPYQVALIYGNSLVCGGSIIGKRWILTAAHCTSDIPPNQLSVRVGSSYHNKGGVIYKVKNTTSHDKFNWFTMDYDFSLVELEKSIKFGIKAQPIALPKQNGTLIAEIDVTVSGWGRLSINNLHHDFDPYSNILTAVKLKIVSRKKCLLFLPNLTARMLCAGMFAMGKGSCGGDSGGPLVFNKKLVGVVSFQLADCSTTGQPSIYAKVSNQREWITAITGI